MTAKYPTGRDAICRECSARFYRTLGKQVFCSKRCRNKYHRQRYIEQQRIKAIESFREALNRYDARIAKRAG